MAPTTVAGYGGILLLVGGLVFVYGIRQLRPVYHILTNDPVPVQELVYRDGPTETEGTATTTDEGETVRGPFSGIDCLACEYKVQELRSSGQSHHWKTLEEGVVAVPFLLDDETGTVRVEPAGATLAFEKQVVTVSGGDKPPETIANYIRQSEAVETQHDETIDLVVTELTVGNDQRFIERRLDVDESVYVYGDVERAPTGEWGRDLVDAVLTHGATETMVISDTSERGTAWRLGKRPLAWTVGGLVVLLPGVCLLGYWLVVSLG